MPSHVFALVFGNLESVRHGSPHLETYASTNVPTWDHAVTSFKNVQPLTEELQQVWFSNSNDFMKQDAYFVLRMTVDRFRRVLAALLEKHDNTEIRERLRSTAFDLFAHCLPQKRFEDTLSFVLYAFGARCWGTSLDDGVELSWLPKDEADAWNVYHDLIRDLQELGLAGDPAARAYAAAIDNLLDLVIREEMGKQSPQFWGQFDAEMLIADSFEPFVQCFMRRWEDLRSATITPGGTAVLPPDPRAGRLAQTRMWVNRGLDKVAKITSKKLYGLIVGGHIQEDDDLAHDLEAITNTPAARGYITQEINKGLAKHLLHPGSSTVAILDAYVRFIRALRRIDKTGIVLVRTAAQITAFLHTRDDAVRIVILSLLEPGQGLDGEPLPSRENFSGEIAKVMMEAMAANSVYGTTYYPGKDLTDINWEPEPIDAFSGFRAARYRDAMGLMVAIKEKDAFIDELRSILGERLLKSDTLSFDQEERLLAMFNNRFEEIPIRECEIMLRDMKESNAWHREINRKRIARAATSEPETELQVKVVSHTYWPPMRSETFELPPQLKALANEYNKNFQQFKSSRRLEWLNAQGRVTVELELEDRTVTEEVTTWQAAVIYQFDDGAATMPASTTPVSRSVSDIETAIQMDEDFVRSALTFWVSKLVLQECPTNTDTYIVLETLSDPSATASPGAQQPAAIAAAAAAAQAGTAAAAASSSDLKTAADLLAENAPLYTNFVVNMLTNQGHMPAGRMMMMLKMLVAGGFPFEEAEFVEFLQGLEVEGKLEKAGGLWMAKKV